MPMVYHWYAWVWSLICLCMVNMYVCIKSISHLSEQDPWRRQKWIVPRYTHTTYLVSTIDSSTMNNAMHHAQAYQWYTMMSCHAMPCHAMQCHIMSCNVISYHVMSCHVMPCHTISYYIITRTSEWVITLWRSCELFLRRDISRVRSSRVYFSSGNNIGFLMTFLKIYHWIGLGIYDPMSRVAKKFESSNSRVSISWLYPCDKSSYIRFVYSQYHVD